MSDGNVNKRLYTMTDTEIIKRLLSYAIPFIPKFILTLFLMLFSVLAGLLEPFLTGKSIDIINDDVVDLQVLYTYLGVFIVAILVGNILNYVQTIILQKTGQSIIYNIREEIFTHLEYHDVSYLNKTPTGALVTRVTNDTNTLSEMYTNVIVSVFRNVIMVVLIIFAMFLINVKLTLLILIVVPFIIFFSFLFRRYSRKAYRAVRANL
jgi:ATP-binding cassette subfamily B protein